MDCCNSKQNKTVFYPAPKGASLSEDYTVKVNRQEVDVYRGVTWQPDYVSSFGGPYSFAYFDFSGSVAVEIVSNSKSLDKVRILPASKGIKASVSGNCVSFVLTETPCYISVEPDSKNGALLLFANPLEQDVPKPGDPGVKYFGPGVHKADVIELGSNETLYIAGGAVVKGGIKAAGENIKILGRGIIDGLDWPRFKGPTKNIIGLMDCDHVLVDGIIVKDGWAWNFNMCGSNHVTVQNLKLMGSRCENNDGIDICNCKHVLIEDSFVRSDDDCIAPKGFGYRDNQAVEDITVCRTSLWTDKAHVWRIGCECRAEAMRDMHFYDIDVLHFAENWVIPGELPEQIEARDLWEDIPDWMLDLPTCFSLQPGEEMPMENIRFENIRINHEGQKWYMEIFPKVTQWAKNKVPGTVKNCSFKDVQLTGYSSGMLGGIRICGPDAVHNVEGINFENVTRYGQPLNEDAPELQMVGHVKNLMFK